MSQPKVLFDCYPAKLRFYMSNTGDVGSRVDRARVIITDERIIVARDSDLGPTIVYNQVYVLDSLSIIKKHKNAAVDVSDSICIKVEYQQGCACGSRLRTWNPWSHIQNSTKDPTE